jgi:multisubunit Na+/H+ antiporter MnhG subunit
LIARVFAALAWIVGAVTVIFAVVVAVMASSGLQSAVSVIGGVFFALVAFIALYAISQFIYTVLDIEENTREIREALKKGE